MGVSRSAKITTLLVIDIAFFFVELIVGEDAQWLGAFITASA